MCCININRGQGRIQDNVFIRGFKIVFLLILVMTVTPVHAQEKAIESLRQTGSVIRGYLGITIQELTPDLAKTFELADQKGILISQVTEGSPAEIAGLKQGDVILEFNHNPVEKIGAFRNRVSLKSPGTKEELTILRNGKRTTITVTIGKLPDEGRVAGEVSHRVEELGLTLKTLTREIAEQFGIQMQKGVIVTQVAPGSVAALAGIQPGSLVQEVNRSRVDNIDEFKGAVQKTPEHGIVMMLIKEGENYRYVALKTE